MKINNKIEALLRENRLREAFMELRAFSGDLKNPAILDKIESAEQTYRYMIHYLVEGSADTQRSKLYNDIKEQIIELADSIVREENIKTGPEQYYAECRMRQLRPQNLEDMIKKYEDARLLATVSSETGEYSSQKYAEAEAALRDLFRYIWSSVLRKEELSLLKERLLDADASYELKSQIISAILLSQLKFYSKNALSMLLSVYSEENISDKLAARLMIAILLVISRHADRVERSDELRQMLEQWNDSILTYQRLRTAIMVLVRSFDTDRINTKMKEEVLPEIMKLQPEIMKRFKSHTKESDLVDMDINPEWEELLSENGLKSKLQEMQEIQMEGGDVMMLAFSNLKSFPFFQSIENWFLPFYPEYSQLSAMREFMSGGLEVFINNDALICNSDKYSFGFAMGIMPKAQKDAMLAQLDAQMSQMKEELADARLKVSHPDFDATATKYVRDLYRFYRLYKKKNEFYDPFGKPFNFTQLPVIGESLSDNATLRLIGEFFFSHGYYKDALDLFSKISADETDEHVLEKIGYCYQAIGQLEQALDYYQRAELLNANSKWLKRKLAYMYRITRRYDLAAKYYEELAKTDPEKISLLMNWANCLLETGDAQGALNLYYKVNFLDPDNENAWRAIAWTELLLKHTDKSKDYFDRVLLISPSAIDYVNAGHRALVDGDYKEAISLYKEALKGFNSDWSLFLKDLEADYDVLRKLGVDISEMPILIDKMKYDLE